VISQWGHRAHVAQNLDPPALLRLLAQGGGGGGGTTGGASGYYDVVLMDYTHYGADTGTCTQVT